MNPILKVTSADYIRNYVLRLSFNDGATKLVDFWPLAQKGICRKLQNMDYFRQFRLDPFSVDWSNENNKKIQKYRKMAYKFAYVIFFV